MNPNQPPNNPTQPPLAQPPILQQPPMMQPPLVQQPPMMQPPLVQQPPILQQPPMMQPPIINQPPTIQQPPPVKQPPMIQPPPVKQLSAMQQPPMMNQPPMIQPPPIMSQPPIIPQNPLTMPQTAQNPPILGQQPQQRRQQDPKPTLTAPIISPQIPKNTTNSIGASKLTQPSQPKKTAPILSHTHVDHTFATYLPSLAIPPTLPAPAIQLNEQDPAKVLTAFELEHRTINHLQLLYTSEVARLEHEAKIILDLLQQQDPELVAKLKLTHKVGDGLPPCSGTVYFNMYGKSLAQNDVNANKLLPQPPQEFQYVPHLEIEQPIE